MKLTSCILFLFFASWLIGCKSKQKLSWTTAGPAMDCYPNSGIFPCPYSVKSFNRYTSVHIDLKRVSFNGTQLKVNFSYMGKIGFETDLLKVNDSLAIKLLIAKTSENNQNKYLYNLMAFEWKNQCWKPRTLFNTFYQVCANPLSLNGYRLGNPGDVGYFAITEGSILFNQR